MYKIAGLSFVFLFNLLCIGNAYASGDVVDAAASAYARMDYATALQIWQQRADKGDATAQSSIGMLYSYGRGVPQDYGIAVIWFRKAAEQGLASAQYALGMSFVSGRGVDKDDAQAALWMRKAAEQGFGMAQMMLGGMYANGIGVSKDDNLAEKWASEGQKSFANDPVTESLKRNLFK